MTSRIPRIKTLFGPMALVLLTLTGMYIVTVIKYVFFVDNPDFLTYIWNATVTIMFIFGVLSLFNNIVGSLIIRRRKGKCRIFIPKYGKNLPTDYNFDPMYDWDKIK